MNTLIVYKIKLEICSLATASNEELKESLYPRRIFAICDYELSKSVLKFFNTKGVLKKRLVLVREIPVGEIDSVESYWNELSVTWNGVTNIFFKKNSYESFSTLRDKINVLLEEHKKSLQKEENFVKIKSDIILNLDSTLPVVDRVFDILFFLRRKRIDWNQINNCCINLGQALNLTPQTLPSLALDFSKLSSAVTIQSANGVVDEVFRLLKTIYEYFNGLPIDDFLSDVHINIKDTIVIVNSYFILNDILLGKIVGQKDNLREIRFFENLLKNLDDEANYKVKIDELKISIDSVNLEGDLEAFVDNVRTTFKEPLSELKCFNKQT